MTGPSAKREQAERLEVLKNDQRATTFHALANLDTSLSGGFAAGGYVSGSEPSVNYPASSGPWSGPQVPPEPPLGFNVNAMEPVGEAHEIAAAALILEAHAAGGSVGSVLADTSPTNPDQRKEDEWKPWPTNKPFPTTKARKSGSI